MVVRGIRSLEVFIGIGVWDPRIGTFRQTKFLELVELFERFEDDVNGGESRRRFRMMLYRAKLRSARLQ